VRVEAVVAMEVQEVHALTQLQAFLLQLVLGHRCHKFQFSREVQRPLQRWVLHKLFFVISLIVHRENIAVKARCNMPDIRQHTLYVQVTATFCIGGNYRDGLDGVFCTTPYEPQTNITLFLTVGDQNLPGLFGSGPWTDSSTQVLTNVKIFFHAHLSTCHPFAPEYCILKQELGNPSEMIFAWDADSALDSDKCK
jgi:hypothetical protein